MNEDLLINVGIILGSILAIYWSKRFWDHRDKTVEVDSWSSKKLTH